MSSDDKRVENGELKKEAEVDDDDDDKQEKEREEKVVDDDRSSSATAVADGTEEISNTMASTKLYDAGVMNNRLLTFLTLSVSDQLGGGQKSFQLKQKSHQFWNSQPVPRYDEETAADVNEPLIPDGQVRDIRTTPLALPAGFEWTEIDSTDDASMVEVYQLLSENYVEDDENIFRFDYSIPFLLWAFKPPGWRPNWLIGVRVAKTKKLVGFISAIPAEVRVMDRAIKMVEINFLCVHKKLREKRMAPVLIREITRRVNLTNIYQAVYTAGVVLPKPIGSCRYWHRSLNPKKLTEVRFSQLGRNMTLQRAVKLFKLPKETRTVGLRKFVPSDAEAVQRLLENYLLKFDLSAKFTVEEVLHWFTPRPDVINSYVVEKNGEVKDFFSFYTLPSTIMHHPVHKHIKAAYLFYSVSTETPISALINDALILAKNAGYDVFNALDLMDNTSFLEELKFGVGDGNLQYYLYNWRCPQLPADKIGLILL